MTRTSSGGLKVLRNTSCMLNNLPPSGPMNTTEQSLLYSYVVDCLLIMNLVCDDSDDSHMLLLPSAAFVCLPLQPIEFRAPCICSPNSHPTIRYVSTFYRHFFDTFLLLYCKWDVLVDADHSLHIVMSVAALRYAQICWQILGPIGLPYSSISKRSGEEVTS